MQISQRQWVKKLFKRLEVEIFYNLATKEYGIRQVWRSRFKRRDGWREYIGEFKAFIVPEESLKEAPHFIGKQK